MVYGMSVREAAQQLGVSPHRVRQLIDQGDLPARRIGRFWVLDEASVRRRAEVDVVDGRPYAARQVWRLGVLADMIAHGHQDDGLVDLDGPIDPQARWQLRHYLDDLLQVADPRDLAWRLRGRADEVVQRYAHPSVLAGLAAERRVVLSGAHAAAARGAPLVPDDAVDAYVDPDDLDALSPYGLIDVPGDANVHLRVVAHLRQWRPSLRHDEDDGPALAPLLLVVADLSERADARAQQAADQLWSNLRDRLLSDVA